ncbi:MAG: prepilin-type N-terminal cleavage/methylation domain-containing protein [Terriglobia bacterium]
MKNTAENGFSLIELLIVVAIILIIAAIAIPNLLESRIAANQAAAVSDLRGITSSNLTYMTMYNQGYAATLAVMAPPSGGGALTSAAAGLLDSDLAAGFRDGYTFTYNPSAQDSRGRYQSFTLNANPSRAGVTGHNFYYSDPSFVIRMNTAVTASASDSPIQ